MRKATIIGGNGYVGRHLLARLLRDGWACWVPQRDDVELMQRDLGHVFYCAGLTADYAERPFDTVEAHTSLLNRVLRDTTYTSLVYLSSTRLYDSLGRTSTANAVTENTALTLDPNNPRHLYDLSKALGESLCRVAANGSACVARLSCVWGGTDAAEGFLPDLMRGVLDVCKKRPQKPRLQVNSSSLFARDYVHIDDVLDALVALAEPAKPTEFGIYNVAGGRNISNSELFKCIFDASGCRIEAAHNDPAPALPRISIERMAQTFGWTPTDALKRLGLEFTPVVAHV